MARTFQQAAYLSTEELVQGVIETLIQESPILDRMPFIEVQGNSYRYNQEATLPGVAWRAVNGSYTESTGTVNPVTENIAILGGDADTDTFVQQVMSDVNDQRAVDTAAKVKACAAAFQSAFFLGDTEVDPNSIDGLKTRLTGGQVITGGTNGIPIIGNGGTDIHAFLDKLDAAIGQVRGIDTSNGAIYANRTVIAKLAAAARRISNELQFSEDIAKKRVPMWNGIPILDAGIGVNGLDILAFDETQGTATTSTSVYVVKYGAAPHDRGVTGLTNGFVQAKDLGEISSKPAYRTRVELFAGMAVFGGQAAARLKGVLNG
ncbi:MAG: hypothetical protein LBE08_10410 [Bifidobacteriaceae bacterium]|jgi:hypothetical protein|nr:hypothetical protein [Bifidobacteriaceae bacterium]